MNQLHQLVAARSRQWREADYPCEGFPAIAEILEYQIEPETKTLCYLRKPQVHALETYWYRPLVEKTPHLFDVYQRLFPRTRELREVLSLTHESVRDYVEDHGIGAVCQLGGRLREARVEQLGTYGKIEELMKEWADLIRAIATLLWPLLVFAVVYIFKE
jgi:hypothetical protein